MGDKEDDMNKFEKWFRDQHGKRPSRKTYQKLREERASAKVQLDAIDFEMKILNLYITRKDTAYEAWLACEKQKAVQ